MGSIEIHRNRIRKELSGESEAWRREGDVEDDGQAQGEQRDRRLGSLRRHHRGVGQDEQELKVNVTAVEMSELMANHVMSHLLRTRGLFSGDEYLAEERPRTVPFPGQRQDLHARA